MNIIPLSDLDLTTRLDGFKEWALKDIYDPSNTFGGRKVPSVDDLVFDRSVGWQIVDAVDLTTGISTLSPYTPPVTGGDLSTDRFISSGPGLVYESFRACINSSKLPYTVAADSRLLIHGTTNEYAKIFLGTDTSDARGQVISVYYDQNGNYISDAIPLEKIIVPNGTNNGVQTVKVGWINRPVDDDETLTFVIYDSLGGVRSRNILTAFNTESIRSLDTSVEYIDKIELVSTYLSTTVLNRIDLPNNNTNYQINMFGKITYNTGRTVVLPCDGTKFTMLGLNGLIPTETGERVGLILRYQLSPGEITNGNVQVVNNCIRVLYDAYIVEAQDTYSVKVYGFPRWVDNVSGYRMEYWLYSLARDSFNYVTPMVTLANNTVFDPTLYGTTQRLVLTLDLKDVDASRYNDYIHVQPINVTLLQHGDIVNYPRWTIAYNDTQTPVYGTNLIASVASGKVNVASGYTDLTSWLAATYLALLPPTHTLGETQGPPTPNYFIIKTINNEYLLPIAQWNANIPIANDISEGGLLYIRFINRTANGDQQLGIAGLTTHINA